MSRIFRGLTRESWQVQAVPPPLASEGRSPSTLNVYLNETPPNSIATEWEAATNQLLDATDVVSAGLEAHGLEADSMREMEGGVGMVDAAADDAKRLPRVCA